MMHAIESTTVDSIRLISTVIYASFVFSWSRRRL